MKQYELIATFFENGFRVERSQTEEKLFWYDGELLAQFARNPAKALYQMAFTEKNSAIHASMGFLFDVSQRFFYEITRNPEIEITRVAKPANEHAVAELLRALPYANGTEFIDASWLRKIWSMLRRTFDEDLAAFQGSAAEYFVQKNPALHAVGRVFFHLVENRRSEEFPFAFLATYCTGSAEKVNHLPLKNALLEFKGDDSQLISLLGTVSRAADQSDLISDFMESGELFSPLRLKINEAHTFLKEIPLYESSGILCRIPDWWKKKGAVGVALSMGEREVSGVGVDAIMSFEPELFLGDVKMTRAEVEALLSSSDGLALIKGKWVEVDPDKLRSALAAFDAVSGMEDITLADAMRLQLGLEVQGISDCGTEVEITNGQWIQSVRDRMLRPERMKPLSAGDGFRANLRAYQQTGFNWLGFMRKLGFGALLADDMGLGKTVQLLALLEYLRSHGVGKTLLIIPASLLFNWQSEAGRFAPELRICVLHSSYGVKSTKSAKSSKRATGAERGTSVISGNRECGDGDRKDDESGAADGTGLNLEEADLFITTYGMVGRLEQLQSVEWDIIILDEAQAIKNASTQQTKAVKQLRAKTRIAMTGTPIENRLADLWSIFDFLNKGLLGTGKEFKSYTASLREQPTGYRNLRNVVSPFILRRLKTDKRIISDLPDKVEVTAYTPLTKKQTLLYTGLVKDIGKALEDSSGIARKGLVLAGIMKFKQICNHPDQYLGQNEFDEKYCGKFNKLAEICETIREKRERVLVFTQFREMTGPLSSYLEKVFAAEGLVIHGGTPVKERGKMVEKFNGKAYVPFMVLSLKAGGVGLNLTAANHVIHFDRWWNPAVENQATDRVFRIGQQKNVMVHKFVTTGTIEEKIDLLLEEKKQLSDDVIAASAGEKWVTEMSNEELMKLFAPEVVR